MACFSAPLATAIIVGAAGKTLPESTRSNPFLARLGWLVKMMFGGSFLLAIEHIYHGEIIFSFPFLTAVRDGETAGMLREIATRGVAMTVLIAAVWVAMVCVSMAAERSAKAKAQEA